MNEYERLKEAFDRQSKEISFLRHERDEICKIFRLFPGSLELKETIRDNLSQHTINIDYRGIMKVIATWGMPARCLIIEDLLEALPGDDERQYVMQHLQQKYHSLL